MQDLNQKYGVLLQPSAKLHRQYFREMVKLLGIYVIFRAPLPNKEYTTYGEIDSNYAPPQLIGCIFDESPTQQTFNKLGWAHELQGQSSIIHVDYDLEGLQQGALFIIPSGLDNAKGRLFRVVKMTNSIIYPSSIACEIVPEFEDTVVESNFYDYSKGSFNFLDEEDIRVFGGPDVGNTIR